MDKKEFAPGYFMAMNINGRMKYSISKKYPPEVEIKALFPDIEIIDNIMWEFWAGAVFTGFYSIRINISSEEEYSIINEYLKKSGYMYEYFVDGKAIPNYSEDNFIYDGAFSIGRYPLGFLEMVRNDSDVLNGLYENRKDFKKFVIVDICGSGELERINNYLSYVYGKRINFSLKYDNKYNILYLSEDLTTMFPINITCAAAAASRTNKFSVDEFILWHSNKIKNKFFNKQQIFNDYKNKVKRFMVKIVGEKTSEIIYDNDDKLKFCFDINCDPSITAQAITFWHRKIDNLDEFIEQVSHHLRMYFHFTDYQLEVVLKEYKSVIVKDWRDGKSISSTSYDVEWKYSGTHK